MSQWYTAAMIEHVSIPVSDYRRAVQFYTAALKPLGYKLKYEWAPDAAGFMEGGHASFIIAVQKRPQATHIAFRARSKKAVQDFYAAALKAGAKDNGAPGFRRDYGPNYYAAFVHDADGNNVEACYFGARASK
ncbi:MAG TPA: VOC family protein [Candidatus Paceibacterota bacterium]|nr:VOC family protein [Candidatus Paceibacterota bacterium]